MANQARKKGGSGTRKYGRNDIKCARYLAQGRHDKNAAKRAARHARKMAHVKPMGRQISRIGQAIAFAARSIVAKSLR
jgi:hypothetical protein